ncbi:MAG: transcription termination/antitermination protein NusA [Deltaproteobacteria bacterium]|jgi:transcription termination/antitermination protein NusA|nr:transcription termination/antitermination protein NusA [Deltaproteobacteria bacterium]
MTTGMFQNLGKVLDQVSKDKGIPRDMLVTAIEDAFLSAARKKWGYLGDLEAHFNEDDGEIELFQFKTAVAEIENDNIEMILVEARVLDPDAEVGDSIGVKMDPSVFGRIAAQTAKQVIIQKVRDAERSVVYEEFKDRLGELITGVVRRFEKGDLVIDLGRTEAVVPRQEQVHSESYRAGERLQGFFLRIDREGRGPAVVLSRRNMGLLLGLFALEVPEIAEGIVEIRSAAREPGVRSKIAVYSKDSDVDPVGACVGMKGSRVQNVVGELKGEKIDIVMWDTDPARFVCNALAPAEVVKVIIREREHSMEVVVPDDQLSLAIGRRGQNVRLAAQLTAWNIDVFSETKIEQVAMRARKVLENIVGVDESTTKVLYSHSFRSFEDIANSDFDEFSQVPGFGAELLKGIYEKSKAALLEGKRTEQMIAEMIKIEEEEERKQRELDEARKVEEDAIKAAEELSAAENNESTLDEVAELEGGDEPTLAEDVETKINAEEIVVDEARPDEETEKND